MVEIDEKCKSMYVADDIGWVFELAVMEGERSIEISLPNQICGKLEIEVEI